MEKYVNDSKNPQQLQFRVDSGDQIRVRSERYAWTVHRCDDAGEWNFHCLMLKEAGEELDNVDLRSLGARFEEIKRASARERQYARGF